MTVEEMVHRSIPLKASDCILIRAQKEHARIQLIKWINEYTNQQAKNAVNEALRQSAKAVGS